MPISPYNHEGYFDPTSYYALTAVERQQRQERYRPYHVHHRAGRYDHTKILYLVSIDIIFQNMLGYSDYCFSKHF